MESIEKTSQTLFCTLACTAAVNGKKIALPNPAIVWNIAPATPWSFLGKLCVVKSPKHGYRVSAPKAARHIAGNPYAKYDVEGGMGTARRRLAITEAVRPKMRMKSPRRRARRYPEQRTARTAVIREREE
jgi:hypothetical protein